MKTIYFINGCLPNEKAIEFQNKFQNVVFRNSFLVKETSSIEKCDFVAGDIPEIYKKKCKLHPSLIKLKSKIKGE